MIKQQLRLIDCFIFLAGYFLPVILFLKPSNNQQLITADLLEITFLVTLIALASLVVLCVISFCFKCFFQLPFLDSSIALSLFFFIQFSFDSTHQYLHALSNSFVPVVITMCLYLLIFLLVLFLLFRMGAIFKIFISLFFIGNLIIGVYPHLNSFIFKNLPSEINKNLVATQSLVASKDIFYVVLDGMMSLESADQFGIVEQEVIIENLRDITLKHISHTVSSYSTTYMTLASVLEMQYMNKPTDVPYKNREKLFPLMMYLSPSEIPLVNNIIKSNMSFIWSGNKWGPCRRSSYWTCVPYKSLLTSRRSYSFFEGTLIERILLKAIGTNIIKEDAVQNFIDFSDNSRSIGGRSFVFIHDLTPHDPYIVDSKCNLLGSEIKDRFKGYKNSYKCALFKIDVLMSSINKNYPDSIVIVQSDHGWILNDNLTAEEKLAERAKNFTAIKAPQYCFDKFSVPKNTVNTIRFAFNCSTGNSIPYVEDKHYINYYEGDEKYGTVDDHQLTDIFKHHN